MRVVTLAEHKFVVRPDGPAAVHRIASRAGSSRLQPLFLFSLPSDLALVLRLRRLVLAGFVSSCDFAATVPSVDPTVRAKSTRRLELFLEVGLARLALMRILPWLS